MVRYILIILGLVAGAGMLFFALYPRPVEKREPIPEFGLGRAAFLISKQASMDLVKTDFETEQTLKWLDEKSAELSERLERHTKAEKIVQAVNRYFFEDLGFQADLDDPQGFHLDNLLVHRVWEQKKGSCVALAVLYLSLTEKLGLPFYGVAAPSHFFLRYDDGKVRINIETLEGGKTFASDRPFKKKYFIRQGEPFYLKNLGAPETFGAYLTNLGSAYMGHQMPDQALVLLKKAFTINPEDVEVMTNLGTAHEMTGNTKEAIALWHMAVEHNAFDDKAHYNLALIYTRLEQYDMAIRHFDKSLLLGHEVDYSLMRALEPHRHDSYNEKTEKI